MAYLRLRSRLARALLACCVLPLAATGGARADEADAAAGSRAVIERLFDIAAQPVPLVDPNRRYLLLVNQRRLLDLDQLAAPVISVAGRDINPLTHNAHAPLDYFALTLVDLVTGEREPIPLPRDATIGFPSWAPDGSRFAFTLTKSTGTEIWIGEPTEGRARKLADKINASWSQPCVWMPNSRRVLCRRVARDSAALRALVRPASPYEQNVAELTGVPGAPTIVDQRIIRSLLESQVELIDVVSTQRHAIGPAAAIQAVEPAPSGAFLLVTRVLPPYPQVSGIDRMHTVVEIWDIGGRLVKRLPADLRAPEWHASKPATLAWVENDDDGDRIMLQDPPFSAPARELFRLENRFSGLDWIDGTGAALIRDYSPEERLTRVWTVETRTREAAARVVQSGSVDSTLEQLGAPVMHMNRWGFPVVELDDGSYYVKGEAAEPGGARPFLARVDMVSGETTRIWNARDVGYEEVIAPLTPDARVLLTRYQSAAEPPNYFVGTRGGRGALALTEYRHPAPGLRDAVRVRLNYTRADGIELSSDLYLPPNYDARKPLPLVLWAYPRQVGTDKSSVSMRSRERFLDHDRAFKLMFLLRGYAVMNDVAMPIVGSPSDANDTFIAQIVSNAEAAISAAVGTGLVDESRVGVTGHSYGAFMVANLLAHSRLFDAGVALSGAYNRTLTPFGFQTERRTFWEAPSTYLAMSPFIYSNQIDAPLLLVHGLKDRNAGTSPMQSTQFYQAIRGNGGRAELLLLPLEGHSYRAKESVLRTATAMLEWFDRYL